uniref:Uncharacterized protein n=1 Tax=Quercus lobata TaxID=97700 RepID=A0A7N2MH85_QUELO
MAAPFVGGASLEATLEEVLQVLHDRVNNVGGKVLMVKSFFKKLDCPEQGTPSLKMGRLSCLVPRPPDFTVWLDVPLEVLKTQLLKEKKQQLLLTAPGGCGKTALMKRLGHDQEIKVMDECPLSLTGNSHSMPNVQAPQFQYDFIESDGQFEIVNVPIELEDDEDDEDYDLSDFSESDDDINEDIGMEDDRINRAIGGKA